MNKQQTEEAIKNIKAQLQVVGETHDLLHVGTFSGNHSQKILMGQAFLKGLYEHTKAELDKLEASLPTFTEQLKADIAESNKA